VSADIAQIRAQEIFNYALYEAKVSITDPSDASVRKSSTDLARAINLVKERPEVAELGKRLVHLGQAEPMSVDPKLLAPQSPESYVMTLRDGETLKFVRIESPKLRPFYLCTTELSLGQFIELKNINLAGTGTLSISSSGDVASKAPIDTKTSFAVQGLKVTLPDSPPIELARLEFQSTAKVCRPSGGYCRSSFLAGLSPER